MKTPIQRLADDWGWPLDKALAASRPSPPAPAPDRWYRDAATGHIRYGEGPGPAIPTLGRAHVWPGMLGAAVVQGTLVEGTLHACGHEGVTLHVKDEANGDRLHRVRYRDVRRLEPPAPPKPATTLRRSVQHDARGLIARIETHTLDGQLVRRDAIRRDARGLIAGVETETAPSP